MKAFFTFIFACLLVSSTMSTAVDRISSNASDLRASINPGMVDKETLSKSMRVAGLQMEVTADISANTKTILEAIERASEAKVDFLMTPEGSLSGYNDSFDRSELLTALGKVTEAAKNASVGLLLGTCYKEELDGEEKCWNQIRAYSPAGNLLMAYSKILRCSPIEEPGTGEMLDYEAGELETFEWNGIQVGMLVCNDLWATPGYTTIPNPYLPLQLKKMGAEIIFHAINSGKNLKYKPFHESSVELWAESLSMPIFEVNAAKGRHPINARSGLINAQGQRVSSVSDSGVQFFVVDIDLSESTARKTKTK